MEISTLFLQRYNVLCEYYLDYFWEIVPEDKMRQRPDPRVNSVAWNIWHLTRGEDAGLNRFVAGRPQVLDEGSWMDKMNLPWRHHGSGMTFPEVDELDQRIDLPALRDYSRVVQSRTREIVSGIDKVDLDSLLQLDQVRAVVVDEGLAHSNAEELAQNYTGWSRGRCLMTFGLTHPFQHVGEIGVIAGLLGIDMG